jgi:hypothetical protein
MSDQVLPPPFESKHIILSAAHMVPEPLYSFMVDLAEDMDNIKTLNLHKSAIILANEILKEADISETE